jgi:WD40 repeat protein
LTFKAHESPVDAVCFSNDARLLATGSDGDVAAKIWDTKSWRCLQTIKHKANNPGGLAGLGFSPDGTLLTTVAPGSDSTIFLWDWRKKTKKLTLAAGRYVDTLAYAPNGAMIAAVSIDNWIINWNAKTGKKIFSLKAHIDPTGSYQGVYCVAFNPDSKFIATGGADSTVRVWDAMTGKESANFKGHTGTVDAIAWSPNGCMIASGAACGKNHLGEVIFWDFKKKRLLGRVSILGGGNILSFSHDNNMLATGDGERERTGPQVWEVQKIVKADQKE